MLTALYLLLDLPYAYARLRNGFSLCTKLEKTLRMSHTPYCRKKVGFWSDPASGSCQPGNVGLGGIEFTNIREYHESYETRRYARRSPGAHGDHIETALTHAPVFSFTGDLVAADPSIIISDIETELRNATVLA